MNKLLMHICCAPCLIYPWEQSKDKFEMLGFFYNPNIHPYVEYSRRKEVLRQFATDIKLEVIYPSDYEMEEFLRRVVNHEIDRCRYCYELRFNRVIQEAEERGCDFWTTTLLVSPYQKNELIREVAETLSRGHPVRFYYQDWRPGYLEGRNKARTLGLYLQPYCGCIYSEKERFLKKNLQFTLSGKVKD